MTVDRDNLIVQVEGWGEYSAVSYTHLDVYKRQQALCSSGSQKRKNRSFT